MVKMSLFATERRIEEVYVYLHQFLTLIQHTGAWSTLIQGKFPCAKEPWYPLIGDCVEKCAYLGILE